MPAPERNETAPLGEIDSDQPISTAKDDLLSRASLVAALKKLIVASTRNDRPLTIAINAPWGAGKSSFLNLLEQSVNQEIKKRAKNKSMKKMTIIRFNPWHYNSTDDLVLTMLSELNIAIGKLNPGIKQKAGELLTQLAKSQISKPWWVDMSLALATKSFGEYKSPQGLREELDDYLTKPPQRIIVLIDDVDRLECDVLRILFKTLRLIADLPNVTYILAYDRNVVEGLLQDTGNAGGPNDSTARRYLEKIVQLSVDLPQPEVHIVRRILRSQMEKLLEEEEFPFSRNRFEDIMRSGFLRHFRTIRSVRRYMNGVVVMRSMLAEKVDPADFFAIELIRLFHPAVFLELANAKDILTDRDSVNKGDQIKRFADHLLENAEADMKNHLKTLLQAIFPQIRDAYDGRMGFDPRSYVTEKRKGNVCVAENFDKYFHFPPQEGIPESRIRSIVAGLDDEQHAMDDFRDAVSQGTAFEILERIDDHPDKMPPERLQTLVRILFKFGDSIRLDASESAPAAGLAITSLILQIMRKLPEDAQKGLLTDGINNGESLWTVMNIVAFLIATDAAWVLNLDKDQTKAMAVERIRKQAGDESLWVVGGPPDALPFVLERWFSWGEEDEVKSCIENRIQDDGNFLAFLWSFVFEISPRHDDPQWNRTIIDLTQLRSFVDVETVRNRLRELDDADGDNASEAGSLLYLIDSVLKTK